MTSSTSSTPSSPNAAAGSRTCCSLGVSRGECVFTLLGRVPEPGAAAGPAAVARRRRRGGRVGGTVRRVLDRHPVRDGPSLDPATAAQKTRPSAPGPWPPSCRTCCPSASTSPRRPDRSLTPGTWPHLGAGWVRARCAKQAGQIARASASVASMVETVSSRHSEQRNSAAVARLKSRNCRHGG